MKEKTEFKIAAYLSRHNDCHVTEVKNWIEDDPDYARISEIVTVILTPLPEKDVLLKRVEMLDAEIERVQAETEVTINDLKEQKQRLLAIEDKS